MPEQPIDLPAGSRVWLEVTDGEGQLGPGPGGLRRLAARVQDRFGPLWRLFAQREAWLWLSISLAIYAFCRLWALERFPIYFFADEAFHPVRAVELANNGLRSSAGQWLPIYFEAAAQRWTPTLALYVHMLPAVILGKTVVVTRATTAVVSLLAALAVARLLARPFGATYWWAGVLLLGAMPAWLLHSRTGFETAMMATFFACCLWCYARYRLERPIWLIPTLLFGAMTFYTYSNGQVVMGTLALLLALSDARFHLRQGRYLAIGLILAFVLALPFLSFQRTHRDAIGGHLRMIGSYWYDRELSGPQKLRAFAQRYLWGISPQYWFVSHDQAAELRARANASGSEPRGVLARLLAPSLGPLDLERHRYRNLGHIPWWLAPLFFIGLLRCLRQARHSPGHRAVLLAALAAPAGAALAEIGITRVLAFLIPAAILTGYGLDTLLGLLGRRIPARAIALATFLLLATANLVLIRSAVLGASRWYSDYGLYGMQYGAIQLYEELIPSILRSEPRTRIMMSSQWANGADIFPSFFLEPELRSRVQHRGVGEILLRPGELTPDMLWVLTPSEYEAARSSGKFQPLRPEKVLRYPDGSIGFYFVRLAYSAQAPALFEAERRERAKLVSEQAKLGDETIVVRHSASDMGRAQDLFDGEPFTLLRGMEANPFIIEIEFPRPRKLRGIMGLFSSMDLEWRIAAFAADSARPVTYELVHPNGGSGDVRAILYFDRGPAQVSRLRMAIRNRLLGDFANIHVRELELLP